MVSTKMIVGSLDEMFSRHDKVLQNGTATRHTITYIKHIRSSHSDPTFFLFSLYLLCLYTCQLVIATVLCFSLFLKVHISFESMIPYHCHADALSYPQNNDYINKCDHERNARCDSLLYSLKSKSLVVLTAMKNETRWSTKYQIMSAKIAFHIARNSEKVERRRERRHVSLYHILFVSNECSDLCLLTLHAGILFRVKCPSIV